MTSTPIVVSSTLADEFLADLGEDDLNEINNLQKKDEDEDNDAGTKIFTWNDLNCSHVQFSGLDEEEEEDQMEIENLNVQSAKDIVKLWNSDRLKDLLQVVLFDLLLV